ncbi:hypothetical protein NQ317_015830 [Molorchus minor]|uniref:Uncharacterized protein n=1 Tax=Molorchus minor TaxID=1323400 RepID=A0ABQ9JMF0_9CUCU|nr:hypothetical protein NQ317_015830 [Molorchus minor]
MAHVYARPHHMLQTEEEVLDIVKEDPSTSTREIARQRIFREMYFSRKRWKTSSGILSYFTVYLNKRLELAKELNTGISVWELDKGLDYFYDLL